LPSLELPTTNGRSSQNALLLVEKMSTDASNMEPADRLARLRAEVRQIRQRAANLLDGGANGIQAAAAISDSTDQFLVRLMEEAIEGVSPSARESLEQNTAIVAIGGSGRGDCAPYSDVDVLFLHRPSIRNVFVDRTSQVVRDC
jgi:[protein-PII] uridylyltransferase